MFFDPEKRSIKKHEFRQRTTGISPYDRKSVKYFFFDNLLSIFWYEKAHISYLQAFVVILFF